MYQMKKVYIWGAGKYGRKVLETINIENVIIKGFIDNDPTKSGELFENIKVIPFRDISNDYDMIIISIVEYYAVLYQLKQINIDFSKVIVFLDEKYCGNIEYSHILDRQKWRIVLLEYKIEKLERILKIRFDNVGYEIIDKYRGGGVYQYPCIGNTEEAVDKIVNERCSLVRFGDGEFEIMAGKERPIFQNYEPMLAKRLREIISSKEEKLLIAISNNYGNLDMYTEDSADGVRLYMNEETRRFHMSILEKDRVYYDAYMFKLYNRYKNRQDTWKRVALVKRIWARRDVVIVEGHQTRTGYGNDLLDNVKSLRRILCPMNNVFDKYKEVLEIASKLEKECLILVALGPTAELLVYDLMKKGYQSIDIGQIDMDYWWYLLGVEKRVPIPDRCVSQLPPTEIEEVNDVEYRDSIVEQIF